MKKFILAFTLLFTSCDFEITYDRKKFIEGCSYGIRKLVESQMRSQMNPTQAEELIMICGKMYRDHKSLK